MAVNVSENLWHDSPYQGCSCEVVQYMQNTRRAEFEAGFEDPINAQYRTQVERRTSVFVVRGIIQEHDEAEPGQ